MDNETYGPFDDQWVICRAILKSWDDIKNVKKKKKREL